MLNILIKYNLFTLLLSSVVIVVCAENETVKTTHGLVRGKLLKTFLKGKHYYGYTGIPYAAPPVKQLRFLPPQDLDPWEGVLSAKNEKPACIQFNTNIKKGQPLGEYGAEDCLYLDIYTPALDKMKRPSLVFLYNEYFKNSYNKSLDYAPDFFIEEDIIVLTVSHRLAVLGFLSVEDALLPGNAGLKDIVAALNWIRNNIERFGGDPERITLMGSQGGAVAVDLLIRSNAKELFDSAILQSGTSLNSIYLQDNVRERAFKLGELLDRASPSSSRLLQNLKEIPVEDLLAKELAAAPDNYSKESQRPLLNFGPIVEKITGGLVTEYPENALRKINVPVMIGSNSREGLEFALPYLLEPRYLRALEKDFPFIMPLRSKFKFDPLDKSYDDAINDIKNFYFPRKQIMMNNIPEYITFIGDALQSFPIDQNVKMLVNLSESQVFYYHFDYYSDLNENRNSISKLSKVEDGIWGAATGDELCYLFKCPSLKHKYVKHHTVESEEMKIQIAMIKLWANFVKYGNPTPSTDNPLNVQWPPYSMNTKKYLHIGRQVQIKRDLYKGRFQFWERFIRKWEDVAGKSGIVSDNKRDEL